MVAGGFVRLLDFTDLRWVLPMHPGDVLFAEAVVTDLQSLPALADQGVVMRRLRGYNQDRKTACVVTCRTLVMRRAHVS